jgi:hypothetical protein
VYQADKRKFIDLVVDFHLDYFKVGWQLGDNSPVEKSWQKEKHCQRDKKEKEILVFASELHLCGRKFKLYISQLLMSMLVCVLVNGAKSNISLLILEPMNFFSCLFSLLFNFKKRIYRFLK